MIGIHVDTEALRRLPAEERQTLEAVVRVGLEGCTEVARADDADIVQLFRSSEPSRLGHPRAVALVTGLEREIYPDLYATDEAGARARSNELAMIAGARVVAVPSDVARRDVIARAGREAADVVRIGAPVLPLRGAWLRRGPRDGIVVPGAVGPHRNAESVIVAYAGLPPAVRDRHPLVLGAGKGDLRRHLMGVARAAGVPAVMAWPLPACLAQASIAVFPSFWDGYSPGASEALAAGVRIAASTAAAAAEVAVDPELLFDPRDAHSLARVLTRALASDRQQPPRQIVPDAGEALREVWERLAASPRGAPSPEPATVGIGRTA